MSLESLIVSSWACAFHLMDASSTPRCTDTICCCPEGQIIVYKTGEDALLTDTGHHGFTKGAGGVSVFDPNI